MTSHVPLNVSQQQQQQQQALTSGTGQHGQQDASATPFGVASLQVVLPTSCAQASPAALKSAYLNIEHSVGNMIYALLLHHSGQQYSNLLLMPCLFGLTCMSSQHKQMSKLAAT